MLMRVIKKTLLFSVFVVCSGIVGVLVNQYAGAAIAESLFTITGTGSRRNTVEWQFANATAGGALDLLPGTDNINSIGSSGQRVKSVYGMDGIFSTSVQTNVLLATSHMIVPAVDVTVTTPTYTRSIVMHTDGDLFIATSAVSVGSWVRVGTQS